MDRPNATLYAGTVAGVFASSNGGATWAAVNTGLSSLTINALILDSGGTLYAATDGAGAFRLVPAATARPPIQGSRPSRPTRRIPSRP
jgi:ligand-binding sensor domain-containing protein